MPSNNRPIQENVDDFLSNDFLEEMKNYNNKVIVVCERHGKFTRNDLIKLNANIHSSVECPECLKEKQEHDRIEAKRKFALKHLVDDSGIPIRFQSASFDNYHATNAQAEKLVFIIKQYGHNFVHHKKLGTSLIFCGKTGTGKTHLACALLRNIAEKYFNIVGYTTAYQAIQLIRSNYKTTFANEQKILDKFLNPSILVLDEIGVQYGTESEHLLLFSIINGRYEKLKPTIVISNLNSEEIIPYLGDRNYDRLRDNGGAVLNFDWESWRLKKKLK